MNDKKFYKSYSFQMLRALEASYLRDSKDPTLTLKEQATARANLKKVREAMSEK